jgi:hypothetical protein
MQHESPVGHPGVRNLKAGLADRRIAIEHDVQIQRSGPIADLRCPDAAKFLLNGEKTVEQCSRREVGFQLDSRIDETRLV